MTGTKVEAGLTPEQQQKFAQLSAWWGSEWRSAREKRLVMQAYLLELLGYPNKFEFLQQVAPQTAVVTLMAGSATRWQQNLEKLSAKERVSKYGITDINAPRALAPVINLVPQMVPGKQIPIGIYPLLAGLDLGKQIIVYRTEQHRNLIEQQIVKPLGIDAIYFQQHTRGYDQPLGHGDALVQLTDQLTPYRYVLCHFGSDANSRQTMLTTLMVLAAVDRFNLGFSAVLPSAYLKASKYPVFIDDNGWPAGLGHVKLKGDANKNQPGLSNVSIFGFLVRTLKPVLQYFDHGYREHGSYLHVNGKNELAVDNIMEYLMTSRQVRQLCIADGGEIEYSVKTPDQLELFIKYLRDYLLQENNFYK